MLNKTTMKVKDFISQEIDIDTYNTYTDYVICFCGPCKLTAEGKKEFADILDLDVVICEYTNGYEKWAEIIIPNNEEEEKVYKIVKHFLASAAGYCSESNYNKWFKEGV